jgi:hypothetical protein
MGLRQVELTAADTAKGGKMDRDEYTERMKRQIDDWNAKLDKWRVEVQKVQTGMKAQYQEQIAAMEKQRDEALKRLEETRNASQAAWMQVSKGAESAWKTMQSSFESAWGEFQKKKKP